MRRIIIAALATLALALIPRSSLHGRAEALRYRHSMDGQARLPLNQLKLPAGFSIDLFATGVGNARQMVRSPKGTVYVGSREPE